MTAGAYRMVFFGESHQNEKDKLDVCIDAMNDGFIFIQMPAKALHDFFGQNYNTKRLKTGGKVFY